MTPTSTTSPGQQGPEGPARRQGRQPRRDDQPGSAGAARASRSPPRRAAPTSSDGRRARRPRRGGRPSTSRALEEAMGRRLGDPDDPLLVSVRSGAKFSMPGMMETVLNIGLNDESVRGSGRAERRRAVRAGLLPPAAADVRRHRAGHRRRGLLRRARRAQEATAAREPTPTSASTTCAGWSTTFKGVIEEHAGRDFPQDPREQLDLAMRAVFDSWNTERAVLYRRQERIPEDLGTAVNMQAMVFGNRGDDSGSGVALHPRPGLRQPGRVRRLPAERAGRGRRRRHPQHRLAGRHGARSTRRSHDELLEIMATLEHHYRDMCDIEFTVERGKLWMLQTRVGKRTPEAAFRIAVHMVDEGLIDMDEALRRVTGAQLAQLMFPRFDETAERDAARHRHERLPRRRRRQGRLRLRHRRRVGRARRGRHPGPQGDQPRRPARHGGRPRRPDQPRRQDLARRRRRPRHGPHLRLRRRGARRRRRVEGASTVRGGQTDPRGRRDLDRRHHRRGLRRRGAGRRLRRSCATSRARTSRTTTSCARSRG